MVKYIVFDSKGQAIAMVPAETAEEATSIVLQNPELSDAVKMIPEEETWAFKAQNQKAEMNQGMQQAVQAQHQEDLANEPWFKKIGRNVASAVLPNAMATANAGRPDENIQEALLYGDVPMYAGLATGNPALAGAGAMWGNTVGQTRGKGRSELDPVETGVNTLFSGLPVIGGPAANAIGRVAKSVAPNILHSTVVPKSGMMKGANPADFEFALKQGDLIPSSGNLPEQISGFERNVQGRVANLSAERAAMPEWETGKVNLINGVFVNAKENPQIARMELDEQEAVLSAIDNLRALYADKWGAKWESVKDIMNERTALSRASKIFVQDPQSLTATKKAKAIIAQEMGKYVKNIAPEVMDKTREMAPFMSLTKPLENAESLTRGKSLLPLGLTQSFIAGATVGGLPGGLAGMGAYSLAKSPSGAQRVYNIGRSLQSDYPGLSSLSMTAANQAPNIDFLMNKIFGEN